MENAIEVAGLDKSFGAVHAVGGIDFYVEQGSLFSFLGENGAGKSTTIDMLCTLLRPDGGNVMVNGFELGKQDNDIRNSIGIVFQNSVLDGLLTVEENLNLRAGLYGKSAAKRKAAVDFAAQATGVSEFFRRPYGKLSGGQRRRADFARALVNTPRLLFLDEPTTGLDPKTRQSLWQTMKQLRKETNMTIFLTTHYMEEAAQSDYITIMQQGTILTKGTPMELKERYAKDLLKLKLKPEFGADVLSGQSYKQRGEYFELPLESTLASVSILNRLQDKLENFEVVNGTMDDVFLAATGKEQADD